MRAMVQMNASLGATRKSNAASGRRQSEIILDSAGARPLALVAVMLAQGILNPHVLSLLARVRHTNALVIADRGFPFWPAIETIDLSLVDGVPTVLQVLAAVRQNFVVAEAYMAEEFLRANPSSIRRRFMAALKGAKLTHEPHVAFKQRVPGAIGLIRTADTVPYANMILVSG
jgi:D-ribose pyranase